MGMALGILFIHLSPWYAPDLMSYLFGNILTVPVLDLQVMLILDVHGNPIEPPKMMNLALFRDRVETHDFEVKWLVNADDYDIDVRKFILRELAIG
jgi:alpha-beta hydrolase superfamily lysophospholipase